MRILLRVFFVAYLIFIIAKDIAVESFHILIERNLQPELMEEILKLFAKFPEVRRIDRFRGREHGHYIILDLRISIDYFKTIQEGLKWSAVEGSYYE